MVLYAFHCTLVVVCHLELYFFHLCAYQPACVLPDDHEGYCRYSAHFCQSEVWVVYLAGGNYRIGYLWNWRLRSYLYLSDYRCLSGNTGLHHLDSVDCQETNPCSTGSQFTVYTGLCFHCHFSILSGVCTHYISDYRYRIGYCIENQHGTWRCIVR